MVTWNDLAEFVGLKEGPKRDEKQVALTRDIELATALVQNYCAGYVVPTIVIDEGILLTAAELFDRASTPNNVGQIAMDGSVQVRLTRDPMRAAYPILNRWVVSF